MLKFSGFKVVEAVDAASGIEQFNQNPDIDLVFTDVIMAGDSSGIEMAKETLAQNTNTPILLVIGYSAKANALVNTAARSDNIGVLSKPYDTNEIP